MYLGILGNTKDAGKAFSLTLNGITSLEFCFLSFQSTIKHFPYFSETWIGSRKVETDGSPGSHSQFSLKTTHTYSLHAGFNLKYKSLSL